MTTDLILPVRTVGRANIVLVLSILVLPLMSIGCSNNNEPLIPTVSDSPPPYDPSLATGRVSGSILFEGKVPELGPLTIGGDAYCKKNARTIFDREKTVTPDGRVQNVIVYVKSGFEGGSYAVPGQPVVLDQQDCVYLPRVLTLMKGQKMKILNGDPTFHNVHAQADGRSEFNIAQAAKGAEDIQTFSRAIMPFKIGCDFHGWMVAYAGVFEHPFHTTSNADGRYELNLPPGKYEIVAWHSKYGEQVSKIEVAAGPVTLAFKFSDPGTRN